MSPFNRYRIGCVVDNVVVSEAVISEAVISDKRIEELSELLQRQHRDARRKALRLDTLPVISRHPQQR